MLVHQRVSANIQGNKMKSVWNKYGELFHCYWLATDQWLDTGWRWDTKYPSHQLFIVLWLKRTPKPELSNLTAISFLRSSKCTSLSSLSLKLIKTHGMKHHVTWSSISTDISFHTSRLRTTAGDSWIMLDRPCRGSDQMDSCLSWPGATGIPLTCWDWIQSLSETTFPQNPI